MWVQVFQCGCKFSHVGASFQLAHAFDKMERRPLLTSMDDDYASYALSQRMSFEHTFAAILTAALDVNDEPVLSVVGQAAADGVNSYLLIRTLVAMRAGRSLVYPFVDMPTNAWAVAARKLGGHPDLGGAVVVVPHAKHPLARDLGTGPHASTAEDHAAITGEALADRAAWREHAARQWDQLMRLRAREPAPGGWFIAALPASSHPHSHGSGTYAEIVHDMNEILAAWVAEVCMSQSTTDAMVAPVWMRTVEEIRVPFDAGGGEVDGLVLKRAELFRLDNPYVDPDPAVFARRFVQSCLAWGGPLFLRAFAREGEDRAHLLLGDFVEELEARVAADPGRYRWDYIEALVAARKRGGFPHGGPFSRE